jgi:O-antigen ligase
MLLRGKRNMNRSILELEIKESVFNTLQKISFAPIFFVLTIPAALVLGGAIGAFNPLYGAAAAGCLALTIIVLLRQDELTIAAIIAAHLYVDWYLGLHLVALALALGLLFVFYFGRSVSHPWIGPRSIGLWILFLTLTIYPAIHGGKFMLYDAATFYPGNVLGAFMMFWLGNIIAKDMNALRRVFQLLALIGSLVAIHTLIEAITGTFLFESSRASAWFALSSDYQIYGTAVSRASSFFLDPNWNGTFLATAFFLPAGLFVEARSFLLKMLYLVEMFVILPALMYTYSNGAWIAVLAGIVVFLFLVGRNRYRMVLTMIISAVAVIGMAVFPSQIALQLQRATGPGELPLREAVWQTAIRVIEAFPLFGVGLGFQAYLIRSNPYRSLGQYLPLAHPHNSYLEWGAMAGIPVLIVFLLLLAAAFRYAGRNWFLANERFRPLLGGGIAALAALSINSLSINGWTLPPIAAYDWLIAGLVASPFITQYLMKQRILPVDKVAEEPSITSAFSQTVTEDIVCS